MQVNIDYSVEKCYVYFKRTLTEKYVCTQVKCMGRGYEAMERFKNLDRFQKGILIFMMIMALVFAVVYPVTMSKVGFEYKDTILVPGQENGNTVYSGKIQGQQAQFVVSEDKTIVFQYGDTIYGPYTVTEDPTAVPKGKELADQMTGVEIRNGKKIFFRGGVLDMADSYWLYNEDGTVENFGIIYVAGDGVERDESGNIIDPVEPTATAILELVNGPELTHKGEEAAWFVAVFICILNAISILFVDELFRWNLAFRIRNVDYAEPSEWEIMGRYIGWIAGAIVAMAIFIIGLQ